MAPFRGGPPRGRGGRGGFSRGGAGGARGGGGFSRGGRGGPRGGGRGGRGGDRGGRGGRGRGGQRFGRNEFRTSRVQDVEDQDSDSEPEAQEEEEEPSETEDDASDESDTEAANASNTRAYNALLQTFQQASSHSDGPQRKRRRVEQEEPAEAESEDEDDQVKEDLDAAIASDADEEDEDANVEEEDPVEDDEHEDSTDPFELHFARPEDNELQKRLKSISGNEWRMEKTKIGEDANLTLSLPATDENSSLRKPVKSVKQLKLKQRLAEAAEKQISTLGPLEQTLASYLFNYQDILCGARSIDNAASLRKLASLHALNHVYKGRDRILKNSQKLAQAENSDELELRDQGFTRPKVLILLETRQACSKYIDALMELCQPEQQENKKRFQDGFVGEEDKFNPDTMPADYRELFEGNDDNDFRLGIKFTRKTVKYFSQFYASDIILASALGLRRIIENPDPKKADSDFLSSIEVCIVDQADAMLMQNWEHVEFVFSHLNLQPKDAHGCDFSRVRNWYLDNNAKYMRQTIVLSAFITPELNRLYNASMQNLAGKAKYAPLYQGAIVDMGMSIKQTFSRFDSPSPVAEPDDRFKYFTSAIVPSLTRLPKAKTTDPITGAPTGPGVLVFVPSYLDFVRVRNYFANSNDTQHISFGAISEYTSVSDSRRARSHFLTGRHAVLLYTGRAHHFHRYRIRGVKRVVMYGLPDNATFYRELVQGFLGTMVQEGRVDEVDVAARAMFSRFDALRLERVVGSSRVGNMLREKGGDTFDFI